MKSIYITIIVTGFHLLAHGQLNETNTLLKLNGKVWFGDSQPVRINGIAFLDSDSVKLSLVNNDMRNAFTIQAISNIRQIRESKHAFVTGGGVGLICGALLGYGFGYLAYDENPALSDQDNKDNAQAKGVLYGIGGGVAFAAAGALVGGIIIRKKFPINGSKQRLIDAITKIRN